MDGGRRVDAEESTRDKQSRWASNRKGLIDPDKNKKDGTIWRETVGDEGTGTIRMKKKEIILE